MRIGKWARAMLAAAPMLAGCGNFWQPPSGGGGGGCTTNCTTLSSGYFYVLNQTAGTIAGYSIVSGALTAVTGGPITLPAPGSSMAVAPNGNFLYVGTTGGIFVYDIDSSTGALTAASSGSISYNSAYTMQVDATSQWLVYAITGVAAVNAIHLDSSTGLPFSGEKEVSQQVSYTTVTQMAISPDTATTNTAYYVFVSMGSGGTAVVPFNPNNTDPFGKASTIALKNSAGGDEAVAVDPSNRLLYVGETADTSGTNSGGLRVFTIGATSINEVTGSPYPSGGIGPRAILPDASGDYVYVANWIGTSAGSIAEFSVTSTGTGSATTYSLKSGTTVSTGDEPNGLAEDSKGNFILVVDFGSNPDLEAYTISSGALTSALSSSTVSSGTAGAYAIVAQ